MNNTITKQKIVSTLRATAASLLTIFLLAGCDSRREFRVPLASKGDESISADTQVFLDDRANPIGRVVKIDNAGNANSAIIRITDHAALNSMRIGIERSSPGGMSLSSVHATGAPLSVGALIPTRTATARVTTSISENIEQLAWTVRDYLSDHPAAAIAAACLGLLVVIGILRAVFRKVFCLLLVAAAVATTAHAGPPKPAEVEADISASSKLVDRAEDLAAEARRLMKAGLAQEADVTAVRAYLLCDRSAAADNENSKKIDLLSSWRADSDARDRFHMRYQNLQLRRATVEDMIADIAATATNGLIPLYLTEREHVKVHINQADIDDEGLIQRLFSLVRLGRPAAPLIQNGTLSINNISNCRIEQGNLVFPNGQVLQLASKPALTPTIVTNFVVRTNVVRVATPAPLPIKVVEYRTNVQQLLVNHTNFVTNPAVQMAVIVPPVAAVTSGKTLASTNATTSATSSTVTASKSRLPLAFALVGVCVVMVVVLAGFGWLAALRGRLYSMSFATETGETRTEELAALEDVLLLLGSSITRDHASVADPSSHRIAIGWHGPVLRSGTSGSVAVNDAPVLRPRRLLTGDRIAVTDNNGQTSQLTFLSCEPVELVVAGETITSQP